MAKIKLGRRMPQKIAPIIEAPNLDLNIARVRAAYFRNRRNYFEAISKLNRDDGSKPVPQWDGGHDNATGKNYKTPVWSLILKFLNDNQLYNIEGYITAQFQYIAGLTSQWRVPRPTELKSSKALANYNNYSADATSVFRRALLTQHNVFDSEQLAIVNKIPDITQTHKLEEVWAMVLRDTSNELTPLFRYCVGIAQHFEEIINAFEDTALNQFLLDPYNYRKHWELILPSKFIVPITELIAMEQQFGY